MMYKLIFLLMLATCGVTQARDITSRIEGPARTRPDEQDATKIDIYNAKSACDDAVVYTKEGPTWPNLPDCPGVMKAYQETPRARAEKNRDLRVNKSKDHLKEEAKQHQQTIDSLRKNRH